MAEPIQQHLVSTFSQGHVTHVVEQHQVPTCSDLGHISSSIAPTEVFHSDENIQRDMELWNRIREYDQKSKEEEFTPVLSKKQKLKLRQQIVLGKPLYKTH